MEFDSIAERLNTIDKNLQRIILIRQQKLGCQEMKRLKEFYSRFALEIRPMLERDKQKA